MTKKPNLVVLRSEYQPGGDYFELARVGRQRGVAFTLTHVRGHDTFKTPLGLWDSRDAWRDVLFDLRELLDGHGHYEWLDWTSGHAIWRSTEAIGAGTVSNSGQRSAFGHR